MSIEEIVNASCNASVLVKWHLTSLVELFYSNVSHCVKTPKQSARKRLPRSCWSWLYQHKFSHCCCRRTVWNIGLCLSLASVRKCVYENRPCPGMHSNVSTARTTATPCRDSSWASSTFHFLIPTTLLGWPVLPRIASQPGNIKQVQNMHTRCITYLENVCNA